MGEGCGGRRRSGWACGVTVTSAVKRTGVTCGGVGWGGVRWGWQGLVRWVGGDNFEKGFERK